jgi:outer membrane PBP1 activator LpoA protein
MSKEYYKKAIIDARAAIAREREQKKKDNARIAASIRSTSSPEGKARYRKDKVSVAARHDAVIEGLKRRIESYQQSMRACK